MKTESVKVSVIMSVFNGEKYVGDSVNSILGQNFEDFEFIIINDGSTDHTQNILESFQDNRMKVYHQKNMGLTKSLNKGITLSQGKYIARQDADDLSSPYRIGEEVKWLDNYSDLAMVGTYVNFIDNKGNIFKRWNPPSHWDEIKEKLDNNVNIICHGSVMMRRYVLDDIGCYREQFKYTQDFDLWLRISEKYQIANIPLPLYSFRRDSRAISRRNLNFQLNYHLLARKLWEERREHGFDSLEKIDIDHLERDIKERYNLSKSDIHNFKAQFFRIYLPESVKAHDYVSAMKLFFYFFKMDPDIGKLKYFLKLLIQSSKN